MKASDYHRKDCQGNNVALVDGTGAMLDTISYYPYGQPIVFPATSSQTPAAGRQLASAGYLYGGKRYLQEGGISAHDFGPRLLPSARPAWTRQDRLAEKYYGISPYTFCMGDPVNYVDTNGLKPTETEALRMAQYVYMTKGEKIQLEGGWEVSLNTNYNVNKNNGLKTMLFQRLRTDGEIEYTLAFAGTDGLFDIDTVHDVLQVFGLSGQYWEAMELAKDFKSQNSNEITFVGHSLGGGLSAASAYATGGKAITFNAAGVSPFTIYRNKTASIEAYITTTDILNIIQKFLGLEADGEKTYKKTKFNMFSPFEGHRLFKFEEP